MLEIESLNRAEGPEKQRFGPVGRSDCPSILGQVNAMTESKTTSPKDENATSGGGGEASPDAIPSSIREEWEILTAGIEEVLPRAEFAERLGKSVV